MAEDSSSRSLSPEALETAWIGTHDVLISKTKCCVLGLAPEPFIARTVTLPSALLLSPRSQGVATAGVSHG
jgi:hypothetical protein